MPILPLYGHMTLREKLAARARDGTLPASLLLHGAPGVGKQRLALWLGQVLLCQGPNPPCGECQHCRFTTQLTHPDLHWIFPRPRLKSSDPSPEDVGEDIAQEVAARVEAGGVYARPGGSEGIFVATVRLMLRRVSMAPALARRKVFVIGDAERMVPQEGSEQAANAFLKLLEEPPADTSILLTSSEPASLLPTIRSRVVALRVPPLGEQEVRDLLQEPAVREALEDDRGAAALVSEAAGAPGRLFGAAARGAAIGAARKLVDAALAGSDQAVFELALAQNVGGARGAFSETLDALTWILSERLRDAVTAANAASARAFARAIEEVERAKERAGGNVNPQLLTWELLRAIRAAR